MLQAGTGLITTIIIVHDSSSEPEPAWLDESLAVMKLFFDLDQPTKHAAVIVWSRPFWITSAPVHAYFQGLPSHSDTLHR